MSGSGNCPPGDALAYICFRQNILKCVIRFHETLVEIISSLEDDDVIMISTTETTSFYHY